MFRSFSFIFAAVVCLSACAQNKPIEQGKAVGMANPASQYCVNIGGQLEIKRQIDGSEYGVCHLPNGKTIGEWELFRFEK